MKKLFVILIVCFASQSFSQSIAPGIWKSEERVELAGIDLPSTSGEECLSKEQAKDAKSTIAKELKEKGCSLTKWTFKNKKLDAKVSCQNDDLDAKGELSGEFSHKKYNLKGEVKGTYKQAFPAVAKISLTGQWVRNCAAVK